MAEGPYRSGGPSGPAEPGRQEGLVQELIDQFADPLAFHRELVQNSLDAGATTIAATLAWAPAAGAEDGSGVLQIAMRDDGCGMGREVLESQLTVLFRSGKEGVEGKIGKFGVGFVSVLAIKPTLVVIRSSEGRGEQWTLHLHPDHSFDLFRAESGGASGTTVTLHVPLARAALDDFVKGSQRALSTWCRHVEVPLHFVAHAGGDAIAEARIDRPLGVDATIAVEAESKDGRTRVVAGLPLDRKPYLGFFNRGLLLYETTQGAFGPLAVKIQDSRLEHTLSRDDVRRDAHHERAMRFAREVVDGPLTDRVRTVLDELAARQRSEPPLELLVPVVMGAGLWITARDLRFPLMHPVGDARVAPARWLERDDCYVAAAPSALSEAVAASGGRVVDLRVATSITDYHATLSGLAGRVIEEVGAAFVLAKVVEPEGSDLALLEVVTKVLSDVAREPSDLRLVELEGALRGLVLAVTGRGTPPALIRYDDAKRDPFRLLARPPLWLDAQAPLVAAARRSARTDPELAGALLARAILLHHGALDEDRDEAWVAACAARLEGER